MRRFTIRNYQICFLLLLLIQLGCSTGEEIHVNSAHLDYLYEEINAGGTEMAIIHIYSNAPDYKYIGDDDEGIACIDDGARAAIFYLYDWQLNRNNESIQKNKKLIEFILYMQAENGYFYNFIWDDYSINKDFKTSVAEPHWWSWRALWALTESYSYYQQNDPKFAERMWSSIEKIIKSIKEAIPTDHGFDNFSGLYIPDWLPQKYASDQSSVLLLGLCEYYKVSQDTVILDYVRKLSDGIMAMQIQDDKSEYYGAFLSWQNSWHAWGNLQSYALLKCYPILNDERLLSSVLKELDNFYPSLISNNYLTSFTVENIEGNVKILQKEKYSQIAYNIRPMVFALLEAFKITGKEEYAEKAALAARWFTGQNILNAVMYNSETGRVFDGINSEDELNKNSGAESTVEGLLTLNKIFANKTALKYFLTSDK